MVKVRIEPTVGNSITVTLRHGDIAEIETTNSN